MRMINRIKQAMNDSGTCNCLTYEELEIAATAALEAMREPSDNMMVNGGLKLEAMLFEGDEEYTGVIFKDCALVFRTMIDAALNE